MKLSEMKKLVKKVMERFEMLNDLSINQVTSLVRYLESKSLEVDTLVKDNIGRSGQCLVFAKTSQ